MTPATHIVDVRDAGPSPFIATTAEQAIAMIEQATEVIVWARDPKGRPIGFRIDKDEAASTIRLTTGYLALGFPKVEAASVDGHTVWIG
jgi:hypothetical protein